MLSFYPISGSFRFINEVGIEDVKLVSLDDLRRRIIVVVMGLIILVPFISHLDAVEVSGFARPVFACPLRLRTCTDRLFAGENLLVLADSLGKFSFV